MKRKILSILSIIFIFVSVLGAATGCKKDPEPDPVPSAEQGEYYYSAGAEEYSLKLILGNTFTLEIKGGNLSGKYVLDGELLTLSEESGKEFSATYVNDVITLTFINDTYRFLRKVNYTVSFDTNGGSAVKSAEVLNGKTLTKPENPTKGDLVFVGWYTDKALRNVFSFTQPITSNLTLYARFVERINPEFTVNLDVNHEGGEELPSQTTVGHKLFDLPTPEWAGHNFVGWWISHYGSADKLTAQYNEQMIDEPITLYAVWESNAPAVSVTESGVSWTGRSGNVSYTVSIFAPDGSVLVDNFRVSVANYAFDFSSQKEGDYVVEVTFNGQTATAYYKNRGLARVTDFSVQESTLLFNAVPNATNYLLTVECGSSEHSHVDIDLGSETSYDFSECDMKANGITFTVKATADGYVSSVSESFTFTRTLGAVTGLTVDADNDVVSWNAVDRALSYIVSVSLNGEELYNANVGSNLSFDLQYYNSGEYTVKVTPVAFGWLSSAAEELNYAKKRIATPSNIRLVGSTIEWDEVDGATGYEVTFEGVTYQSDDTCFELKDEYYDSAKSSYTFTARALGADAEKNSLRSPEFTIRNGEMGEVSYQAGSVVWDAVFGIDTFLVKLNEGEATQVTGTSLAITLPANGKNTAYVSAVYPDGTHSEWKSVEIFAYALDFDACGGQSVESLYLAKGDPVKLPSATRYGFTFNGWYTEVGENGRPYDAPVFEDEYDRTLYANWTPNEYKISFDLGEYGDEPIDSCTVDFGSRYTLPVPTTSDPLYAFSGWFNSGKRYTNYKGESSGEYLDANDITLTANWVPIFSFKQNDNGTYSVSKGQGIGYVTEVTVPVKYNNNLVSIVQDFTNCGALETIRIPDSVTNIVLAMDGAAFQNCNALKNIIIYDSNINIDPVYFSVDGVLFYYNAAADNGRMEIKYYPYGRQEAEYTIPGTITSKSGETFNVTAIPSGAFRSSSSTATTLTAVNIPATVSLIELNAFYYFTKITSINFLPVAEGEKEAASLSLRENAFGDSSVTAAHITYIKLPKRLSENPREAFANLTYLGYIDAEEGGTFSSIDGLLTQNSEYGPMLIYYPRNRQIGEDGAAIIPGVSTTNRATEFVVPDGIYAVGEKAVLDNTALKKVVIPGHVRYIGISAFQGLRNVEEILFTGEKDDLDLVIDEKAFLGENWTNNSSPNIPNYSLNLQKLTLPANLTKIGKYAFGALSGGAKNSNALHTVTVNVDRTAAQIDFAKDAFSGSLKGYANSTSYITKLYFGAGVPMFEILDVFGPNVMEVYVDEANPNYWTDPETGVLYDGTGENLILFPVDWVGPYTLPETVTNIQSGMFKERKGLTEIVIHAGVARIGDSAFAECTGLEKVTFIPGGDQPLVIEAKAFNQCTSLTEINLPERTVSLGSEMFRDCSALASFTVPKNVQFITGSDLYHGELWVFYGCSALKEIKVAEGNTYYAAQDNVLYSLRKVKLTADAEETVYVPDKVIFVPAGATGEITVSGYIRSIGSLSFSSSNSRYKPNITKIYFEDSIPTYDPETGDLQDGTINFNWATGVSSPGMYSPFGGLSTLLEIRFPVGMTVVPDSLIYGCTYLKKINIPKTVTSIQARAFYNCNSLSEIIFDEGGTEALRIEDHIQVSTGYSPAYYGVFGQTKIANFVLPARTSYIGSYVFAYSSGGQSSDWTSNVETIKFAEEAPFGLTFGAYAFGRTKKLKTVELASTLTTLVEHLFDNSGIQSLTLPEGLTTIGNHAFYYCSALTSISFPESLKAIGSNAFYGTKLSALTLNEGLETIGDSAFSGVSTLGGTLNIPASVTSIGKNAFTNTNFESVKFAENNKLATISDSAFSSNKSLMSVEFKQSSTPLTFGASVFSSCTSLTSFEFPANVKEIGASIFANLANLKEVTFAKGTSQLESVGQLAFSKTGLESITFPESSAANGISLGASLFKSCTAFTVMNLSASISSIDGVLSGCASIKTITIDPDNSYLEADATLPIIYEKVNGERGAIKMVYGELSGDYKEFHIAEGGTSIGANAFANQTGLEIVYIPASVKVIGDYAFQNCVNLKKVILAGDSVLEEIGSGAFMNCLKLEYINLEDAKYLKTFGDGKMDYSPAADHNGVFMYAGTESENELKITLPASVEKVGSFMFAYSGAVEIDMSAATQITQLHAGKSTTSYGGRYVGFFSYSEKLRSIKLPSSITFLGTCTFGGCTALEELDLSNLTKLVYAGNSSASGTPSTSGYLFCNCTNLKKVIFPTSLTRLGGKMFTGCDSLSSVEGLDNVTTYSDYAFSGVGGMLNVTVSGTLGNYMFAGSKVQSVTFESISKLTATYLFKDCASLETVDMRGASITAIPNYMFQNCTALTTVYLPEGLVTIGNYAFDGCTALQSIDIPASVTALGTYTFRNSGLTSIDLSALNGLTRLGAATASANVTISTNAYVFQNCTSLTEVKLPDSLKLIGAYTFDGCTSLNKINLDKVTLLGNYSFRNTGFTEVTLPSSVTSAFGTYLFSGCLQLTKVVIPDKLGISAAAIGGNYMFRDCTNLSDVTIGTGFKGKTLPANLFQNCTSLETVDLSNLTALGNYMFSGCSALKNVTLPESYTVGTYVFQNCALIESMDLSGCTSVALGNYMFDGCSALKSVILSEKVNYLGTYTFRNCTSLTSIDISNTKIERFSTGATTNVTTSPSYTFAGCTSLKEIIMRPGQITQVAPYTFQNCTSLTSFDFSGITRLGAYAFQNAGLTGTVTLPATLTYFNVASNYNPFTGCANVSAYEVAGGSITLSASNNKVLSSVLGALLLDDSLIALPGGADLEQLLGGLVKDGVLDLSNSDLTELLEGVQFGPYLFWGISGINTVILPADMTELPAYLFYNSLVEEVVLPDGLVTIGNYAFQNSAIKRISIPASVTSIGTGAFAGTYALEEVVFLEPADGKEAQELTLAAGATSPTASAVGVFRDSAIEEITLPGRMKTLANGTFHYSALRTVTMSEGMDSIGTAAFAYTTQLKTIKMPDSLTSIGNYAFSYSAIEDMQLGNGVETLGANVYSYVETLGDLTPEDFKNVTSIGNNAFEYTTNINNVEFSDKVVSTGNYLFRYSNIENVVFPGSVLTIGNYMFEYCENLNSVVIEDAAEGETRSTLNGTFRKSSIKSVTLGKGITSISGMFSECPNITSVVIPEGVTTVGSDLFKDCTSLVSVDLPESLTNIGNSTFANCVNLKSIVIYENIATIATGSVGNNEGGTNPFAGWTADQTIYFTASRSYIGSLVGFSWLKNTFYSVKANVVFGYEPNVSQD